MPPKRRVRPWIDGEEEPGVAQMGVELLARDAGLDGDVEVLLAYPQHLVHPPHVEGDAALQRADVAFDRGAHPVRHHGHAVLRADADDLGDFLRGLGEGHRIRRVRRVVGLSGRVMLAHSARCREPVAQERSELVDRTLCV